MLLLNGRSISPAAGGDSKWKLPYIQSTILEDESQPPVLVVGITETWLNDTISDAQTHLTGYHCIRSDRDGRRGGGSALYIHEKTVPSDKLQFSDKSNSLAAVYVESLHTIFAVVYRPPDSPDCNFDTCMGKLQTMIDAHSEANRHPEVYIIGDFNLPLFDWDESVAPAHPPNSAYGRLMTFIETNFLTQVVRESTRGDHILDLVLTTKPQDVIEVSTQSSKLSDHKLVDCTLSFNPTSGTTSAATPVDPNSFRAVNYHKADTAAMNEALSTVDWNMLQLLCDECGDIDGTLFTKLIVLTVLQITIQHSETKNPNRKGGKNKMEKELASLKMRKRKMNRKIQYLKENNPSSQNLQKLELSASLAAYEIKDVILSNLDQREKNAVSTIKSNPKFFYSYAKRLAKTKSSVAPLKNGEGALTNNPAEKAEILQAQYVSVFSDPSKADAETCKNFVEEFNGKELNNFEFTVEDIKDAIKELDPYSAAPDGDIPARILCDCKETLSIPLWMLWKRSMDTGVIPPDLKLQYITPIFKKGNRTEAVNYRPVSLTSHLIKIFERVIRKHLVKHLEDNEILPDSQHGFRKNRSCLTQLIEHVDSVLKALNDGSEVDVIYLDYSKAFDKVDHNILLTKMRQYGITGPLYDWIESFLRNRKQTVVVDGEKSDFSEVESGVPQGTVLGPVFFIIYAIDLVLSIKSSKTLTFADDTKLMKAIRDLLCKALLQTDLDSVIQWSIANNMLLHEDKFVVMNYCLIACSLLRELPFTAECKQYYTTSGKIVEPSSHTRDLGVYLSDDCSWTFHINKMTAEARKMAAWVLGAFKDRSVLTMLTLFKSLVRSKVEYCCPLWDPTKIGDIQLVENVQRQFTRKISGMNDLEYWERLAKLKLLSLQRRRERYTIIHVWKMLNDKAPNNIGLDFYTSPRLGIRIAIPKFNYKAQRSYSSAYDNSFGIKSARLWNLLPKSVNSHSSLEPFKAALGEFMNQFPDKPPVSGYTPPNSNSLLDWCAAGGNGVCA